MAAVWDDPRVARGMRAQLELRRRQLAEGANSVGWKVGFGTQAMMQKLGTSAPLVGFLLPRGRLPSGAGVSLAGWVKPVAEPEVAVHIGSDLAGGGSRAQAQAAIAAVGPAIEIVDLTQPPEDVEAILAGDCYQRHVVLGPQDAARAGGNLDGLVGRVLRNDAMVATVSDLQADTGNVVDTVRHVADMLAAFGERLRAGEVIICGSVVPPFMIEPQDRSLAFELPPIGTAAVRFTA